MSEQFTEKEKSLLTQYLQDLLKLMDDDNAAAVNDTVYSYNRKEIETISEKLGKTKV